MKTFTITVFFPEVKPAHAAFQSCIARGTQMSTAVSRGLDEIRMRPALKGKRIREARVTVKELDDGDVSSEE